MKSVAEFKRNLKVGLEFKTIHHMNFAGRNEDGTPIYNDKDLGIRKVSIVQSNSFALATQRTTGEVVDSWCMYPKASESVFDGDTLTILEEQRDGGMKPVLSYTLIK